MTWYLSGPMSGIDDLNFPAFAFAATTLRSQGFQVLSPHEAEMDGEPTYVDYLRYDMKTLAICDGIVLLSGWSKSNGAQLELHIALRLGYDVRFFNERTRELLDIA
jgi:hypothetical protein